MSKKEIDTRLELDALERKLRAMQEDRDNWKNAHAYIKRLRLKDLEENRKFVKFLWALIGVELLQVIAELLWR